MLQYVRSYFNFPGGDLLFKTLCVYLLLKLYQWATWGKCKCPDLMMGKTVLITGGNSGIGKETARAMAKRGARVIIACINVVEGERTKDEIEAETGNADVQVLALDVSSLHSVRKFAAYLNRTERCLDVLIHNAGVATAEAIATREGLELTMATNHYGPFLLTHLLLGLLKRAEQGRIIVVTSGYYYLSCFFDVLNNPNPVEHFWPSMIYFLSNYAQIYFTLELARKLQGTDITANCAHPGFVDTGLFGKVYDGTKWYARVLHFLFLKTPKQGAQTIIHLAVNYRLRTVTGKYFADCQMQGLTSGAADKDYARKFWYISERLVNLRKDDSRTLA